MRRSVEESLYRLPFLRNFLQQLKELAFKSQSRSKDTYLKLKALPEMLLFRRLGQTLRSQQRYPEDLCLLVSNIVPLLQ